MITDTWARNDIKVALKSLLSEFHTQRGASQRVYDATLALLKTLSPRATDMFEVMAKECEGKHKGWYLLWGYQDQEIMERVEE